jgi:CheY-like chemotaxis protein
MARKVLLIDDDPDIQDVSTVVLQKFAGLETASATTGIDGLNQAKAEIPDVILLDISMPDMDGFEVFAQLRSEPLTRAIPVIVLSAKALPSDLRRFADMGVAGVITKPFDPTKLHQQIKKILRWTD